jgi:DNA helicase HerA-like ATPase
MGQITVLVSRSKLKALRNHEDQTVTLAANVGGQIKIATRGLYVIGNISDSRPVSQDPESLYLIIDLVGEAAIDANGQISEFHRGITLYPAPGDLALPMESADLAKMVGNPRSSIEIGTVHPTRHVRACVDMNPLLARHFALVGSTGTGKSNACALLLHRIIERAPNGHVVVIDPHGEYATAFAREGLVLNVDNLLMPYWLMNYEEHCEVLVKAEGAERELERDIVARCLVEARSKNMLAKRCEGLTVDTPIPYLLSDLLNIIEKDMGTLEKSSHVSRYMRLKVRLQEVQRDGRYNFMFNCNLATDSMKAFLSRLLSYGNDNRPITILDLSGVPSDIVAVVVGLVSRIIMDHAIWSRDEDPRPVLLVCEEAHRYVPASHISRNSPVRRSMERIAKEGRKYGVGLGLVSQRPSALAEGALSQCGTIIAMRLNNEADQSCIRDAMPEGGRIFLDSIPALRTGEAIITGEAVTMPMRVRLDMPDENKRPHSQDPDFSTVWQSPVADPAVLDRRIDRWRSISEADSYPVDSTPELRRPSLLLNP